MQTVNAQAAQILATAIRAPRAYLWVQLPLITNSLGNIDAAKLGSQLVINNLTAVRLVNILTTGADTLDFEMQGLNKQYSPLNVNSNFGRYFAVGAVDIKYQLFLGVARDGAETVWPKGVYVSESVNQDSQDGATKFQVNALDQFSLFRGNAYTSFPPRLYGNQQNGYYNPNYALTPDNTHTNYYCEAVYFMQNQNDFPVWSSDWVQPAVYMSNYNSGTTPIPNSGSTAYTWNYAQGKITFTTAQSSTAVVSLDVRPLAMAPELMLKHLFCDFGGWDPNFLKFDQTGTVIPLMELSRDRAIIDIARDILALVGPRGQRWSLWIDEQGYIRFSELAPDGPPVRTITDVRDIIHVTPEYSVKDLMNVIRASATVGNNQPIIVDSYDVYSISTYGQKPTYDVPTQFINCCQTMDVGSAMAFLNNLCNSLLFEYCRPSVQCDIEILPDPTLQVGDVININESTTGMTGRYMINQITNEMQGEDWKQTLRIQRQVLSQDWNFGISANLGIQSATNPNAIVTQSGFLQQVALKNNADSSYTTVVQNGQPVVDASFQPYVFNWNGTNLGISITVGNIPSGVNAYIWRWIYIAEDAYTKNAALTGDGTAALGTQVIAGTTAQRLGDILGIVTSLKTLPYDVRANADTPMARRFWWPILRCSDWPAYDGTTAITTTTTLTSTWTQGPGTTASGMQVYGHLVVGKNDYFGDTTSGFSGVQLYKAGTQAANIIGSTSNMKYGVDFGITYNLPTGGVWSGIKNKQTPAYLCILVATDAGTMQFKKIPFMLSV